MLPATFDQDPLLRVSKVALAIFAIALLVAGFALTVLLAFAVRNPIFQAETVFLPALLSCALGLLTIFYDFLISARYQWNLASLLLTIAAAVTTIIYGILLVWTHRKIGAARERASSRTTTSMQVPLERGNSINESVNTRVNMWQDPSYYENYVQNMYPTSSHQPQPMGYDPNSITEEEMQRQQMLMLLLHNEHAPSPDPSSSTFRIDWQGRDEDEGVPANGYYGPQSAATPSSAYTPRPGLGRRWTNNVMQPWDGVWRGVQPRVGRTLSTEEGNTIG